MRGRKRSLSTYPPCDNCNSPEDVVGYGKRINKSQAKQTYYCKQCRHKFTPDDGFKGVRFPPHVILSAVQLSQKGFTLKQITEKLVITYRIRVGESTIHDWTKKYGTESLSKP